MLSGETVDKRDSEKTRRGEKKGWGRQSQLMVKRNGSSRVGKQGGTGEDRLIIPFSVFYTSRVESAAPEQLTEI